ncbi:MAG: nuclear transport factor 2 family protein [Solirubrobacterales bacterium]
MSDQNVALLEGIYERWSQGDFRTEAAYGEQFSVELGPEFPDSGVHAGLEGVAAYTKGFLDPWERITITAEEMIDGEDKVLVRVLQSGTGRSSGIAVELRYFHLWSFDGTTPARMASIMEEADALARLGRG